jgi:hypothetical protein
LIWKNSDFISEITFTIKNNNNEMIVSKSVEKESQELEIKHKSNLEISNIILPPVSKRLPSIIVLELLNKGNASAKNINISIDLGNVKIIDYEVLGFNSGNNQNNIKSNSIIHIKLNEIKSQENGYIYLHTNAPFFKSITIRSEDTNSIKTIDMKSYLINKLKKEEPTTFIGTLKTIGFVFMWAIAVRILLFMFRFLA